MKTIKLLAALFLCMGIVYATTETGDCSNLTPTNAYYSKFGWKLAYDSSKRAKTLEVIWPHGDLTTDGIKNNDVLETKFDNNDNINLDNATIHGKIKILAGGNENVVLSIKKLNTNSSLARETYEIRYTTDRLSETYNFIGTANCDLEHD